jgi:modulator of FtsH protease HflC
MKQNSLIIGGVLAIVILSSSMFTVHMTQNAVVLELQKPKEIITKPGLPLRLKLSPKIRKTC